MNTRGKTPQVTKTRALRIVALALATVMLVVAVPSIAEAETIPPDVAAELSVLACDFVVDIEEVLFEYDQQIAPFDSALFNSKLVKARAATVEAQDLVGSGDLIGAFAKLKRAQRLLQEATSIPISGTGFADDIAGLAHFRARTFVDELITIVVNEDLIGLSGQDRARARWDEGAALGGVGIDEWRLAMGKFKAVIKIIDGRIDIVPTCV